MAPQRSRIRFLLNGENQALEAVSPSDMLLDYLRLSAGLTGAKEGCNEGDCGACSVLVGRLTPEGLHYETANACIRPLASLDGRHVVTVEALAQGGALHPVQQAMVDLHGSQCGFCTPGIVMSLYALWMRQDPTGESPDDQAIETALQGNLCRCTGYAPILRAAKAASAAPGARGAADVLARTRQDVTELLQSYQDSARVTVSRDGQTAILPGNVADLAAVLAEQPGATIVAGATDVGLWVTKLMRPISPAVFIDHLSELRRIEETDSGLSIGAGVSYTDLLPVLKKRLPSLEAYLLRIGGEQVRNAGTIGGNIANGSPIGDTPPPLIALGAEVTLRSASGTRTLPLEDFFIDYGKQDRAPTEFVESVTIPDPAPGAHFAAYKISKRRDEDISAVSAGMLVRIENGAVAEARLAFGGMAATPKRAAAAEAALLGRPFDAASVADAARAMDQDFQPLSDWRASAEYRMTAARNLLRRFLLEAESGGSAQLARRGAA